MDFAKKDNMDSDSKQFPVKKRSSASSRDFNIESEKSLTNQVFSTQTGLKSEDYSKNNSQSESVREIPEAQNNQLQSTMIIHQFSTFRTKQLILVVFITIVLVFINNFFNQQSVITNQVLVMTAIIFIGCYVLILKEKIVLAAYILLWTRYFSLTILLVSNDGLRDPVVIGYTGLLIFAAMLGHKNQFMGLTIIMGVSILVVGYANNAGWLDYSDNPFGWGIVVDLLVIYSVVSYSIWNLANDLHFALSRLQIENLRVNKSKQEYQRIAHYDHLTGLPNRIIALDRFNQAIFHSHRNTTKVAILFLDIDNFKTVNDSLGHSVGDKLLQKISQRLLESVREGDTVCRLGGDEFLIILDDIVETIMITNIANNLLSNIAQLINIDDHRLTTTCSIGIAISPVDGDDFDDLRKKADMAMYRAKNSGRNGFMFFDDAMNKDMLAHIDRVNSLRNAIIRKEFVLYYQPKINLKTGRIFSAEALIRWKTSSGKIVMPDEFIPIAENTGLIIEIGEWVLYEACRQCKAFQLKGLTDFSIAVNLSSIQFRRGNLEDVVNGALTAAELDASYLEFEVTESLLVENSNVIKDQIKALQNIGVTFSIDDFGTGYSSLAYLKDFNFDFLKIDRTFIEKSIENEKDMVLCEAIIGMAHKLQLLVVAEGVETLAQKQALLNAGCEFGQGNFFSEAISVEEFCNLKELVIQSPTDLNSSNK